MIKRGKKISLHLGHDVREVTNKILTKGFYFSKAYSMSMLHKLSYITTGGDTAGYSEAEQYSEIQLR